MRLRTWDDIEHKRCLIFTLCGCIFVIILWFNYMNTYPEPINSYIDIIIRYYIIIVIMFIMIFIPLKEVFGMKWI